MVLKTKMAIPAKEMGDMISSAVKDRGTWGLGERAGSPNIEIIVDNKGISLYYQTCGGARLWANLEFSETYGWYGIAYYAGSYTALNSTWDYPMCKYFIEEAYRARFTYSSEHGFKTYEEGLEVNDPFLSALCKDALDAIRG